VGFIETMDCLPVSELPEGNHWTYELKLDGYRLEVLRSGGSTILYSRRQNILNKKFDYIAAALDSLAEGTILDGELVAIGEDGKPNFNLLSLSAHSRTSRSPRPVDGVRGSPPRK
jgi:bifunctional non-homologous end joining protein LigD